MFRASHGLMLVGGWGSINLYHSVWELPIMHVVWKIQPSHSCCFDSESMPLKMLFNLYFKIELWHLYKSLLPSLKGLSIYFYVESSPFLLKSTRWRAHSSLHSLLLVYIGYDCDWISFATNYNVQSVLGLQGCSAFIFCGLRKG